MAALFQKRITRRLWEIVLKIHLKVIVHQILQREKQKTHVHFFQSPHLKHCYRISEHLGTTVPGTLYPRFCTFHRGLVVSDGVAQPAVT